MTTYNEATRTYNEFGFLYDGFNLLVPDTEIRYRVQVHAFGSGFSVGSLVVDIDNPKNVGYADYMNGVPEAFFTLGQDDAQAATLATYINKAHVRILRNDRVVWTGWLMDTDENDRDVVFYAYGYLAGLFWTLSNWNQEFLSSEIGTIVSTLWTAAKAQSEGGLGFVATGTIESPFTAGGGGAKLILPLYTVFYKRLLFILQELAALGQSDTGNTVMFEIVPSETPQFNLWANRGIDLPDVVWERGGVVNGFHRLRAGVNHRNELFGVGAAPHNTLLRKTASDATDITAYFRRQEPIFLSWVRDETELDRVNKRRLAVAVQDDTTISLRLKPNSVAPPDQYSSQFRIGDAPRVVINRGVTQIDAYMRLVGLQVTFAGGIEQLYPQLRDKA